MTLSDISAPQQIALGYALPPGSEVFGSLFALETRLGRLISSAKEPALGQLRLAWWREQVGDLSGMAHADPVLQQLAVNWPGEEQALISVIHGWEDLLTAASEMPEEPVASRAAGYQAAGRLICPDAEGEGVATLARWWVAADILPYLQHPPAREALLQTSKGWPSALPRVPRLLRPLSVLAALGQRSIERGGAPMLSRRSDALIAFRVGLLGV